ncbi:MAG: hypothetical protein GY749_48320 [Desulfobacteraceae bacterium]|nr:hypothetical protein [Desulfobacteraceae bacterium]
MGIPVFDLSNILVIAKDVAVKVLQWAAFKALFIGALATILPISIYIGWKIVSSKIFEAVNSKITETGEIESVSIAVTGIAAWVIQQTYLDICFSVVISAIAIRFSLSFFHRWS